MLIPRRRWSTVKYITLVAIFCLIYIFAYRTLVGPWADDRRDARWERLFLSPEAKNPLLLDKNPDDPDLVSYVREYLLLAPSNRGYNLTAKKQTDFSRGQSKLLDSYFAHKGNGIFLDIGSYDGERDSVSLFFEKTRRWKGVLIETDPALFQRLRQKNRRAYAINACARVNMTFNSAGQKSSYANKTCLWVETILRACGFSKVDLLNIDTQDNEMNMLMSIPLKKFNIKAITLEFNRQRSKGRHVIPYLKSQGYKFLHQFEHHVHNKIDQIYLKD